jgi:hypothetical protein
MLTAKEAREKAIRKKTIEYFDSLNDFFSWVEEQSNNGFTDGLFGKITDKDRFSPEQLGLLKDLGYSISYIVSGSANYLDNEYPARCEYKYWISWE